MLSILAMCTPPVLGSPGSLSPLAYRESPAIMEEEEEQVGLQTPAAQQRTPARNPAKSLILPPITPRSSSVRLEWHSRPGMSLSSSPPLPKRKEVTFDILSWLPPELTLKVLDYLSPRDLCRVCLVSRQWNRLASYPPLSLKRKKFIASCREDYQLFKENFPPAVSSSTTPHTRRCHMTSASSPLCSVQPKSAGKRRPPVDHTPSPAYLSDTVRTLSLDDKTVVQDTRRCLFPESAGELGGFSSRNSAAVETCSVVGKKSNRSRLRRL